MAAEKIQMGRGKRFRRWLTWQRVPVERMRILRLRAELRFLLWYALAFVAWSAATGWLIFRHPMPIMGARYFTNDYQYVFLFKIPGLLIIPAIWFYRAGYVARDLLPETCWDRRTGLLTLFGFIAGVFVNSGLIAPTLAAAPAFSPAQLAARLAWGVTIPVINAGIPEEFVFRGLLQTRLEARYGRGIGIVGTALLFTAWHLPTRLMLASGSEGNAWHAGSVLLHTGLAVFLVALVLGWLWDRYRRLIPLMALHWGVDLLPLTAGMLGVVL